MNNNEVHLICCAIELIMIPKSTLSFSKPPSFPINAEVIAPLDLAFRAALTTFFEFQRLIYQESPF